MDFKGVFSKNMQGTVLGQVQKMHHYTICGIGFAV
jgi:hypothetical protein